MKNKQYYIDLYGEKDGLVRWLKGGSLESYIWKYGDVVGKQKYDERIKNAQGKGGLQHYIKKYGEVDGPIKYKEKKF